MIKYNDILKDYNNPFSVLRAKCKDVEFPLNDDVKALVAEMQDYLEKSSNQEDTPDYRSAVGIAAPQVGKALNIFAVNFHDDEGDLHNRVLFNPTMKILDKTPVYLGTGEGCLSIPEEDSMPGYVPRNLKVKFEYFNLEGQKEEIVLSHFASIVYQHEFDHLQGILFFDHINKDNKFKDLPNGVKL